MPYTPRPCVIDVTSRAIADAERRFGGGVPVKDPDGRTLAVTLPDAEGLYDHANPIREALSGDLDALRRRLVLAESLLRGAGGLIDEALTTHIYDDDDEIPDDCSYLTCSREIDAFLEGALPIEPIRIVVAVNGGLIESIFSDRPLPHVRVVTVDYDVDDPDDWDYEVAQLSAVGAVDDWQGAAVTVNEVEVQSQFDWAICFRDPETGAACDPVGDAEKHERFAAFLRPGGDAVIAAATLERLVGAWSNDRAETEGWAIFDSGNYGWEIEHDDEADAFATDDAAVEFVRAKAEAGSLYHSMAMAIHTRMADERQAACLAAGYRVHGNPDDLFAVQHAERDDGVGVFNTLYATEGAAWAAAYRDLGERGE